jgi:endonuclease/exonuclease/phosphatase (EEP) superfamily protein YafD
MLALTGCATATAFSFLGRLGWMLDLFSHFHLQIAAGLVVVAVCFAILRQKLPSVAALLLLSPHLVCLSYHLPVRIAVPAGGSPSLDAVAFNVLSSNQRRGDVLRFLEEGDADIILLVEVDAGWLEALRPLEKTYPHFRQVPRPGNFGMAIYSRFPIRRDETRTSGGGLPCIVTRIDWDGVPLTVIGAHPAPPFGGVGTTRRDEYLRQVGKLASQAADDSEVIVLGDLNTTPWSHSFRDLLESGRLLDSGRHRGFGSTWMRLNPLFSLPLDHVLHGAGLETIDRRIGPDLGSDHRPVAVSLRPIAGR